MDNTVTIGGTINFLALTVMGLAYGFFIGFLILLFKRQDSMDKNVLKILKIHEANINVVDDRVDVLDRAVSNITDAYPKQLNSKMCVTRERDEPTFERVRAILAIKHKLPNGQH